MPSPVSVIVREEIRLLKPFIGRMSISRARAFQDALGEMEAKTVAERVAFEQVDMDGFEACFALPEDEMDSRRVVLYLHGGAYVIGSPATHRAVTCSLAKLGKLAVCAIDYRLAPEHRFPAPVEDAVAAYQALLAMGYQGKDIVIGGDSAGGNLALVTALRVRELGLPTPRALVCFSPVTDLSRSQLHTPPAGDPLLNPAWIEQAMGLYCPAGMDRQDPRLSPLFADLAGLPPLLIQVGEDELLLNDSLRFAEKAKAAGVSVQLEVYPGLWHVFQTHVGVLKAADFAFVRVVNFLQAQGF